MAKSTAKKASTKKVAKKAVKKVAPKKASRKPSAKKSTAATAKGKRNIAVIVTDERAFWVHDGPVLRSLHELADAFDDISVGQFEYHVRGDHNDFASWIEFVLVDPTCADAVRHARTKDEAARTVRQHLKKYEK